MTGVDGRAVMKWLSNESLPLPPCTSWCVSQKVVDAMENAPKVALIGGGRSA